jgi:hypothetical protein
MRFALVDLGIEEVELLAVVVFRDGGGIRLPLAVVVEEWATEGGYANGETG